MVPLWKPAAIADRRRIIAYIAQDKPRAAIELGDLLMEKAGLLDSYPLLGLVGRVTGTCELTVHPHYLLIYRLVGSTVEVLRVKHTAQQWP